MHKIRSAHRRGSDDGLTMTELLVATVIMMIASTALLYAFVQGMNASIVSSSRTADAMTAKTATENATKALRTARDPDGADGLKAFELAAPDEVIFYAALNRGPSDTPARVRIYRDGTELKMNTVEGSTNPATGTLQWTGAGSTRTIGQDIVAGSTPVFAYLTKPDPASGQTEPTQSLLTSGGKIADSALNDIDVIEVSLSMNSSSRRNTTTTTISRVSLLNKRD
ncbi:MAG: hypothetical protein CSA58_07615 [Micrococcales bacterium]|nr:MAG: hypothetical protein CSA58_07615 [Micrococcales bacterium]